MISQRLMLLFAYCYFAWTQSTRQFLYPCKASQQRQESRRSSPRCASALDFPLDEPRNRKGLLTDCKEHSERTCCEPRHTEKIRVALFEAKQGGMSDECLRTTRSMWCSKCDGDVGSGKLLSANLPILCQPLCAKWYKACSEDYFAAVGTSGSALQPCTSSSIVCSRLTDVTPHAHIFCKKSGFEVSEDPATVGDEKPGEPCYSGVPSAVLFGPAKSLPRERRSVDERSSSSVRAKLTMAFSDFAQRLSAVPGWIYGALLLLLWASSKLHLRLLKAAFSRGGATPASSSSSHLWGGKGYRLGEAEDEVTTEDEVTATAIGRENLFAEAAERRRSLISSAGDL